MTNEEILDQATTWRGGHLWRWNGTEKPSGGGPATPEIFDCGTTYSIIGPVHHHPVRDPQDEDLCSGAAASFVGVLSALPIRAQWFPCAWSLMCAMEAYSEI